MEEKEQEEFVIRVEVPMDERPEGMERSNEVIISRVRRERKVSIVIPEGMELSEEEMKAVLDATQNEIVDIIGGERATAVTRLMAKRKVKNQIV
jgi:hypothetical protein